MLGSSMLIIRGIVGIAFGVLAVLWPGLTIAVLVGIFAVYACIDGAVNLVLGLRRVSWRGRSWPFLLEGVVGIGAGVLTFLWPAVTVLALIAFVAAWALVTGVFEIVAAIRLRRVVTGEWLLALSGVLSVLFGVLVFAFPAAGAVGIAWTLGIYAAATGILLVMLGVRLRSHAMVPA